MKIENTVLNQNDNARYIGDIYLGTDERGDKCRRLQYRDAALRLIEKYLPAHRKKRLNEWHIAEAGIVNAIDDAYYADKKYGHSSAVELSVAFIAIFLEAPHLKVYNDPDLPEFMQGYQPLPGLR